MPLWQARMRGPSVSHISSPAEKSRKERAYERPALFLSRWGAPLKLRFTWQVE